MLRLRFEPGTFGLGLCVYTEPLGFEIYVAWWVIYFYVEESHEEAT